MPIAKDLMEEMIYLHELTLSRAKARLEAKGEIHKLDTQGGREEYCAMGLAGEAGEVANLYKKKMRGMDIADQEVDFEMADTLSYLLMLAYERKIDLEGALRRKLVIYRKKLEDGLV